MEVRETADAFLKNGHFDSQTISGCASAVEMKWEKLMKMAERRRAVVFTSYNFYRASEQVRYAIFQNFVLLPIQFDVGLLPLNNLNYFLAIQTFVQDFHASFKSLKESLEVLEILS